MKKTFIFLVHIILSSITLVSCHNNGDEENDPNTQSIIGKWKLESIISADNVNISDACDLKYGGLNITSATELIEQTGKINSNNVCTTNNYDSHYSFENNILYVKNNNGSFEFKYKITRLDSKLVGKLIWSKEKAPNGQYYITETKENLADTYTYSR